jgi:radical SAM superfamily enzyme YgiQ (UPF0313 family)
MPSRILLISANRCDFPYPVFPLGLAMVDTALRQAGHETRWQDCQTGTETLDQALEGFAPDFIGVSLRNIDDVVFRRRETYFGALVELCQAARQKTNCPIVVGGSGFSLFPEQLLELSGADFGIVGEGESSMVSLIAAVENKADPTTVPGLVFRRKDSIAINPRQVAERGSAPGGPRRAGDLVDYYLRASSMLNVQTQRGCAFDCCYCTYPMLEGRRQHRRPAESIAEEFEEMQRLGARYAFVVDSVFNSSAAHVIETCEAILRRGVKLAWGCFLRPQGLDAEQMRLMRRAGLMHIEFGSDSFSDPVLAAYGKRLTFEDISRANELAHAEGIDCCHYLICGGPAETEDTLRTSFRNSQRLNGAVILATVGMRIYPGTPLYERAAAAGLTKGAEDLLVPAYFLAPDLTAEAVFAQLEEFARLSPNWIVGDPPPGYSSLVERLRQRGVVGPLWSYFATLQRIQPRRAAAIR